MEEQVSIVAPSLMSAGPKASEGILMLFCSLFFPSFDHPVAFFNLPLFVITPICVPLPLLHAHDYVLSFFLMDQFRTGIVQRCVAHFGRCPSSPAQSGGTSIIISNSILIIDIIVITILKIHVRSF